MNHLKIYRLILSLAITMVSAPAWPQSNDPPRFAQPKITQDEWQTYFDEARSAPNAKTYDKLAPSQVIVQATQDLVFIFTAPAHPAYPAVVRRQLVVDTKGSVRFARTGHFAGDESAFAAWWKQFDELESQSAGRIRQQLGDKKP